jgi:bile acid-coenzyme A ligase
VPTVDGTPFAEALARLVAADPDRPLIIHESTIVTRRAFDEHTNRLARAYAELGVVQGDLVTIVLPNGLEFYEAAWAAWKLGAVPQPVSAHLPDIERMAIIDLADPALVVGVTGDRAGGRTAVPVGFEPPAACSPDPLPSAVSPWWKAPTSGGSTGRPKLILAGDPAYAEGVCALGELLGMPAGGVDLITGPLYHNGPFVVTIAGMLLGSTQVVMTRFDAETALRLIQEHRVDWMYAVPTMLQRIWKLPLDVRARHDVSSLQVVMHMAAPCPAWVKRAWIDWLGADRVWELYGGTEGQAATVIKGDEWLAHEGSVGRPVLGEMRILDDAGVPLPVGELGEVWMRRGEDAAPTYEYVGAEPRRRDGWESLGDMGWLDGDGYLYLADRQADLILVGGANVYPAEIEAALDAHAAVLSSCVIGLPDEDLGSAPHAIVQVVATVSDDELRAHLRERLAGYKMPRSFEHTDQPLRDDAGKVRRSALRAERLNPTVGGCHGEAQRFRPAVGVVRSGPVANAASLLSFLGDDALRGVLDAARRQRFARGGVVFRENDVGHSLYLLDTGSVAVRTETLAGDVVTLRVIGPGAFFGELALVGETAHRNATVVALEPTEVLALHRDRFAELRRQHPAAEQLLVEALAAEVRRLAIHLKEALHVPSDARILRRLVALADIYGDRPIPVTQADIASISGTNPATVNRVLGEAQAAGSLDLRRGRVLVRDTAALVARCTEIEQD